MVKKVTQNSYPSREKRLPNGCPPFISLGTSKLNVLKELARGNNNSYSIGKKLHFSKQNALKHLRSLRDKYNLVYKNDKDITDIWRITNKGKEYLMGNHPLVMSEREQVTYLQDRQHNIKIKFPIIEKPKDLLWLENWKSNDKMKNNVFYSNTFGDITTTYTGKSLIFQLPILTFEDSEIALAEAGRIAISLAKKYQYEVKGLKLGKEELTCQVISQHHACPNDPYAVFCFKHGISYRDELIDIDASPTKKGEKIPEIEFTSSEESHIHHQRHVDNIKDIILDRALTNKELSIKLGEVLNLLEEQQKANNETAFGLNSITKVLENKYKENNKITNAENIKLNFNASYIN